MRQAASQLYNALSSQRSDNNGFSLYVWNRWRGTGLHCAWTPPSESTPSPGAADTPSSSAKWWPTTSKTTAAWPIMDSARCANTSSCQVQTFLPCIFPEWKTHTHSAGGSCCHFWRHARDRIDFRTWKRVESRHPATETSRALRFSFRIR